MSTNTPILNHVNLIRRGAAGVGRLPFGGDAIVEVCRSIEVAGMPFHYRLSETAREYAFFESSEHIAAALAARVGNPRIPPIPPLWPLLALLLLGWRDSVSVEAVLQQASNLRAQHEVQRGLAIVAHLVPELQAWLATVPLSIPRWERALAVPLAARKLARLENMDYSVRDSAPMSTSDSRKADGLPVRWRVTGGSRRGASHLNSGLKNQDAIQYSADAETVVLAVADGHGGGLSFRSHTGSRLAVETAVRLLRQFAGTIPRGASGAAIEDRARAVLTEELIRRWRTAVKLDVEANPFTDDEWANLSAQEGWRGQQSVKRHPVLAYGSTILVVLATERFVLCMQLGDGDILVVDAHGETHRAFLPDARAAKHTSSLWRRNAAAEFKIHVQDGSTDLPTLILAATDGYALSYGSEVEFLKIGRSFLRIGREEGFDGVDHRLGSFLDDLALGGSGDDVTIGVISRLDMLHDAAEQEDSRFASKA